MFVCHVGKCSGMSFASIMRSVGLIESSDLILRELKVKRKYVNGFSSIHSAACIQGI